MTRAVTKSLSDLQATLGQFQQLHGQCCRDLCAQLALSVSIHTVRGEIAAIRAACTKALDALGFPAVAQLFQLPDAEFNSQDLVDMKRISVMLNQLKMKPAVCRRPGVAAHLRARFASLDALGIAFPDECDALSIPELPSSLNLTVQHDDIELFEEIGVGQSGKVLRGTVRSTGEQVAVKIIHSHALSALELDMFRREVSTMAMLKHPSLLRFCGYTTDYPFYLLTEYMENGSLYDYIEKNPTGLSPTWKTVIALDIARGMEYLHSRGIIHRDLKSLNVLLDGRRRGRVCDFGLIRLKSSDPMTGMVGTSNWMAPEVLLSSPFYDEKVDVFSFGVVLWELLTGKHPYSGEEHSQLTLIVEVTEHEKRPEIPESCTPGLRRLIERCWQTESARRPSFHEIVTMRCDPAFRFPGCEVDELIQEAGIRGRHSSSASLPARVLSLTAPSPPRERSATTESFLRAVRRNSDAMALGHIEHFDFSLAELRRTSRSPNVDFARAVPALVSHVNGAQARFRPRLVQLLFGVLEQPRAVDFFEPARIAEWLRTPELAEVVAAELGAHPKPSLLGRPTVEALLAFAASPSMDVRVGAFAPLLCAMEMRPDVFCEAPALIQDALAFALRRLPLAMVKELLAVLERLLAELSVIPEGVVVRLVKLQAMASEKCRAPLARCLDVILDFDSVNPFHSQIWQNALVDLETSKCLFLHFLSALPANTIEFAGILMRAAEKSDTAVEILARFAQAWGEFRECCVRFLPLNNRNLEIVAKFYAHLLEFTEVLQFAEFYEAAQFLCTPKSFAGLALLFASAALDLELFERSAVCRRIVELLRSLNDREQIVGLLLAIEERRDVAAFREALPILFELLAEEGVRVQAFLALAAMARFSQEGIDMELLRERAVEFIQSPGPGQAMAAALLGREIEPPGQPDVCPEGPSLSDEKRPVELDTELLQQHVEVFMQQDSLGQLLCLSDSDRLVAAPDSPDPPGVGVVDAPAIPNA
jgi:serine/threonine protein kinase